MMDADVVADLNARILDVRAVLAGRSLLRFMTPTNLETQRQLVAADPTYVPVFEYPDVPGDVAGLLEAAAHSCAEVGSVWHVRVGADWAETAHAWKAAASRDAAQITEVSLESSGVPAADVCAVAQRMLDETAISADEPTPVPAALLALVFDDIFAAVDMAGWSAVLDEHASARVTVNASSKLVSLRADASFSIADAARLVVHELGTHALRGFNGASQSLSLLATGTPGYLATEEGLAAWHERRFSTPDPVVSRRYALRALAVPLALSAGWSEVFAEMCAHTSPADAFEITRRVKRGFSDVSQPGAHTKDHVYLSGMLEVDRHLSEFSEDHARLCAAKVSVSDLGFLDDEDLRPGRVTVTDVVAAARPVFAAHGITPPA